MSNASDGPTTILVVEDDALLRLYAAGLLEDRGYEVIQAENAEAALKVMKDRPEIRLLFTDIQMPGSLDGMELARMVHEQWPKVLLLITSGNLKPPKSEIPDHGHFVGKPYRAKEIISEIDDLLHPGTAESAR